MELEANERMPFGMLVDRNANHVLIALSGEFALGAQRRFEEALHELDHEPVHELVVDLTGVTFIDSTAAYLLVELYKRFRDRAPVTFQGSSVRTQELLQTSGLDRILPLRFTGGGDGPAQLPRHMPPIGLPHPVLPTQRRKL